LPPQLIAIITLSGDKSDFIWDIDRIIVKVSSEDLNILSDLLESIFYNEILIIVLNFK